MSSRGMKNKGNARRLGFENLEGRTLLAGNVTAAVANGVLVVTGDDAANFLQIRQLPASGSAGSTGEWAGARYEVINPYVPKGDTPTLINGQSSAIVEGVKNGVTIRMNGGNDHVILYRPGAAGLRANAPGNVDFDMGTGSDVLGVYIVNHQQVDAKLGSGADRTYILGQVSTLNVVGDAAWQVGDPPGGDSINLDLTAAGPVSIDGKYGNNDIRAKLATTTSRATVTIATGNGSDSVDLRGLVLAAPLRIDTGDGADWVTLAHTESTKFVGVNTGRGDDTFVFFDNALDETLSAWLSEGNDRLFSSGINSVKNVVFRGWDGTDTLDLRGSDTFESEDITGFETIL